MDEVILFRCHICGKEVETDPSYGFINMGFSCDICGKITCFRDSRMRNTKFKKGVKICKKCYMEVKHEPKS